MRSEEAPEISRRVRADRVRRAENGAADGLPGKGGLLEKVEHPVLGRIVRRADLLQDHVLLERQLVRIEQRIADDVAEDVEAERDVVLQEPEIVGGVVDARLRVHLPADRLDRLGDVACAPPLRSLEGHVLEEMRDAVLARRLRARARADPEAERDALKMRHVVRDDGDAIAEAGEFDAHPTCSVAAIPASTACSTVARSAGSVR